MRPIVEALESFNSFIYAGGPILVVIFTVAACMWTLLLERFWYFRFVHPRVVRDELGLWRRRAEHTSWASQQIQRLLVSRVEQSAKRGVAMIKTLVALAPLLGLLGTVTGMTEVFQIMAIAGSGNPRAMASGVSRSTIPTMAGMVVALSGMYFVARLQRRGTRETAKFEDELKASLTGEVAQDHA